MNFRVNGKFNVIIPNAKNVKRIINEYFTVLKNQFDFFLGDKTFFSLPKITILSNSELELELMLSKFSFSSIFLFISLILKLYKVS